MQHRNEKIRSAILVTMVLIAVTLGPTANAEQPMSQSLSNRAFAAKIPPAALAAARDIDLEPVMTGASGELGSQAVALILDEGFEGAFPGPWTTFDNDGPTNGEVFWDDSSHRSHSGNWSAWCADGGTDAAPPGGNYLNNMDSWLIYGPFSLAGFTGGGLDFQLWNQSESGFDYIRWGVSIDGTNLYGMEFSGNTAGWVPESLDFTNAPVLGDITGESNVYIGFVFRSDFSNTAEGAYIDDVIVAASTPPPVFGCVGGPTELCIRNRFSITMNWSTTQGGGQGGAANALPLASQGVDQGGLFYFNSITNPEVMIKVLDACSINNRFWIFFSAGTNVGFDITVTDTYTSTTRTYSNPDLHPAAPVLDTSAFATCP